MIVKDLIKRLLAYNPEMQVTVEGEPEGLDDETNTSVRVKSVRIVPAMLCMDGIFRERPNFEADHVNAVLVIGTSSYAD